jgi:hypothetical protein
MAFLDNSGDIILDAVLTDTGRYRLAKGDGSFKITQFVLADDEINYNLYDKNHPSGSAYFDLEILQTPVFEAFTNNTSVVKHPLLSITATNLLYLPVMNLNTNNARTGTTTLQGTPLVSAYDTYFVTCDATTNTELVPSSVDGAFDGYSLTITGHGFRIDQGLDTTEIAPDTLISRDLLETQYVVQIDNRLARIVSSDSSPVTAVPSFIDDDNIASYAFTDALVRFVQKISLDTSSPPTSYNNNQVILGPKGTCLGFSLQVTPDLVTSTFLFTTLGSTFSYGGKTYYYIDSNIVVRGVTTGSIITIPVRFIKYKSTP